MAGRAQLEALEFPDPWRSNLVAALRLIDELDIDITSCERDLRTLGAQHPYMSLLMSAPGIGWVLGYTIAAEIGDIEPVRIREEAHRLHRPVPQGRPVR